MLLWFAVFFLGFNGFVNGVQEWVNPCDSEPTSQLPMCDTSIDFATRAFDYVSRLNLPDLAGLSGNAAGTVEKLNVVSYQWWSEGLHGVALSPGVDYVNGPSNATTMFPQVITTGSTFNTTLFHLIGEHVSKEGRAMWNSRQAGLTFWAPNINIFRDPRWGRGQETPGEDPLLNSVYAKNFISGMQGDDDKYLKVSSCAKHFAAYSLENSDGVDRFHFDAIVSDVDYNETYFPAFQSALSPKEKGGGGASGIMCSYNAEGGIPSCANKELLLVRAVELWGFDGYITGDCGAFQAVQDDHNYTDSPAQTLTDVYIARADLDCGGYAQEYIQDSVLSGELTPNLVQRAIFDLALVQMRLGLFDPDDMVPYSSLGPSDVTSEDSLQLSLEASRQGLVLLDNPNDILPLTPSKYQTVALLGPLANQTLVMEGNYYGIPPFIISVLQGIGEYYDEKSILFDPVLSSVTDQSTQNFPTAVSYAQKADVTIYVGGIDGTVENEGADRDSLLITGSQTDLIKELEGNSTGPLIVVLFSGGCLDISFIDRKSSPVLWAGYPGMFGGQAIAEVLFGDVNPSGLLSQTWYHESYLDQILMTDMTVRNDQNGSLGRGFRFYPGHVLYHFGHGLSYTRFGCQVVGNSGGVMQVNVTNNGGVLGEANVLVIWKPEFPREKGLLRRLVGFERTLPLPAGEDSVISINLETELYSDQTGGSYSICIFDHCPCESTV